MNERKRCQKIPKLKRILVTLPEEYIDEMDTIIHLNYGTEILSYISRSAFTTAALKEFFQKHKCYFDLVKAEAKSERMK